MKILFNSVCMMLCGTVWAVAPIAYGWPFLIGIFITVWNCVEFDAKLKATL